jgi:pimeloyl-ACP methyl ester carboxylesterase
VAAAHTLPRELRTVLEFDPGPDWLAAVTAPTLLLLGGASPPSAVAAVDEVHAALPDARVEKMPDQQHIAMDTAPELFAKLVVDFLQEGPNR